MRIGIIIGHTAKAKGAYSKTLGLSEYDYNTGLANLIQTYAHSFGHKVKIERRDSGGISGAFKRILAWKPHCILELHFNAANGKASGSETLFSDNYDKTGVKELALAYLLSKNMSSALGIPNRGVKERGTKGERGFANLAQTTDIASVLIESGFGDNPKDAKAMKDKKLALAHTIVDAVITWYES